MAIGDDVLNNLLGGASGLTDFIADAKTAAANVQANYEDLRNLVSPPSKATAAPTASAAPAPDLTAPDTAKYVKWGLIASAVALLAWLVYRR